MKKPDSNYLRLNINEAKFGVKVTSDKPVIMHPHKIQKGSSCNNSLKKKFKTRSIYNIFRNLQ